MPVLSDEQFIDLVVNRTDSLSFVRLGDGEGMVLGRDYKYLINNLGYIPSPEDCELIRESLIKSYSDADVIGMPEKRHLEKPTDKWRVAVDLLKKEVNIDDKLIASCDLSHRLIPHCERLFRGRKVLNYVASHCLDQQLKDRFGFSEVNSFIVDPQSKYFSKKRTKHYPEQFNMVKEWMATIPIKGNICLVAAGAVGKVYNSWFKSYGGISLDMGSVFDLWAGYRTRGANAQNSKHFDDTWKL